MPLRVWIFKIRFCRFSLPELLVNGELRVGDNVDKEKVRDLQFDLFFTSAGI